MLGGHGEPGVEPPHGDREACVTLKKLGQRFAWGVGLQAMLGQHLQDGLASPVRIGAQRHARAFTAPEHCTQPRDRIVRPARHRHIGCFQDIGVRVFAGERQAAERLESLKERFGGKKERLGCEHRAFAITAEELVAARGILPEPLHGPVDVAHRDHGRIGRKVVKERGRGLKEQRDVVLHAGERDSVADVAVWQRARGVAFKNLAKLRPEVVARRFVHRELATGQQLHRRNRVKTALRIDVERPDRLDLVIEEIDAVGHDRTHGKQVDQAAAHAELARGGHLRDMGVVGQRELAAKRRFVQAILLAKRERVRRQETGRRKAIERRGHRHGQHVDLMLHQGMQGAQTLGNQVLMG